MSRSRSNNDKPFYVDIGTSIVAIMCASNHDVIERYDHVSNKGVLKLAEEICDRMNKEAEISRPLRNCDLGTAEEQDSRHSIGAANTGETLEDFGFKEDCVVMTQDEY